ncbi:molybdopterin-dependent oxidoreductase [Aquipseudomonas alcaligenes]|uniref:molybdopterin-dependent oxidoreductase n=1 Tax=Aquipseudomonas alcaligenes TaxID=43263 RepID=UPI0037490248
MFAKAMEDGTPRRLLTVLLCAWLSLMDSSAMAEELFSPMLTLRMGNKVIELEREQVLALPQARLTTSTTLSPTPTVWEGPLMRDVLALLGVPTDKVVPIRLLSWDDYRADLTSEDFSRWDVLLAHSADGKELSVETLGPLRVIYPRDQFEELQDQRLDHRWVWMLREIVVEP